MPFFPGREHIYSIHTETVHPQLVYTCKHTKMTTHVYNRTITTQACREKFFSPRLDGQHAVEDN